MPSLRAAGIALLLAAILAADAPGVSAPAKPAWLPDAPVPDADALPPGAFARLGSTGFKHRDVIRSVAASADGSTVVSASDSDLVLWDATTGRERCRYRSGTDRLLAIAAGGNLLAAANGSPELRLIDMATGRYSTVTLPGRDTFTEVAVSPDGGLVAVATTAGPRAQAGLVPERTRQVVVWDARHERVVRELYVGDADDVKIAFSRDGTRLIETRGDCRVHFWDVASGRELRAVATGLPNAAVGCLALSPTGKFVGINTRQGETFVLDAWTGKKLGHFTCLAQDGRQIAFSPDGSLLAAAAGARIGTALLPVPGCRTVQTLHEPGNITWAVAFSGDGRTLVTGGGDGQVRLWDVAAGRLRFDPVGHTRTAGAMAFSPDGRSLASSGSEAVYLWDLAGGGRPRRLMEGAGRSRLVFAPDGRRLAAASGSSFGLWDRAAGGPTFPAEIEPAAVVRTPLAFARGGRSIIAIEGEDIVWRNADDLSVERRYRGRVPVGDREWFAVTPRPGGALVSVSRQPGSLEVWDQDGRELGGLGGLPVGEWVRFLASPDGWRVLVREGNECALWDLRSRTRLHRWATANLWWYGMSVAFSPDGRLLAGHDHTGTVCVVEAASGGEVLRSPGEATYTGALAFSPDVRTLASAESGGPILLWDLSGTRAGPKKATPDAADLARFWDHLCGDDAARAFRAVWRLANSPEQAVPFLGERLKPAEPIPAGRLRELVGALDDRRFAVRQAAFRALCDAAECAEPEIRRAAGQAHSAQAGDALARLVKVFESERLRPTGERLRALRAVQALEYMRTPESRALLERLAGGMPGVTLTREAHATLGRARR